MDKQEVVMRIVQKWPYADQIVSLDWQVEENAIRLGWRGDKFRVSTNLMVEEVEGGCLSGSNLAIVLEALLKS